MQKLLVQISKEATFANMKIFVFCFVLINCRFGLLNYGPCQSKLQPGFYRRQRGSFFNEHSFLFHTTFSSIFVLQSFYSKHEFKTVWAQSNIIHIYCLFWMQKDLLPQNVPQSLSFPLIFFCFIIFEKVVKIHSLLKIQ